MSPRRIAGTLSLVAFSEFVLLTACSPAGSTTSTR